MYEDFTRLVDAASVAYKRFRAEVIDTLPPGVRPDIDSLSKRQQDLMADLLEAEAAVAAYRERQYAASLPPTRSAPNLRFVRLPSS